MPLLYAFELSERGRDKTNGRKRGGAVRAAISISEKMNLERASLSPGNAIEVEERWSWQTAGLTENMGPLQDVSSEEGSLACFKC